MRCELCPPSRRLPGVTSPAEQWQVHVVAGPGAGRRTPLPRAAEPDVALIGRDPTCLLRLDDPGVSRRHAELTLTPPLSVRDLGSANGTRLIGPGAPPRVVGAQPQTWSPAAVLAVGGSRLALRSGTEPVAAITTDAAGHRVVHRAPRLPDDAASGTLEVTEPTAPAEPTAGRLPWAAALVTTIALVPIALVWHQPLMLTFAVIGPLALLAQHRLDRRSRAREHRTTLSRHRDACRAVADQVAEALGHQAVSRHHRYPDPAHLAQLAEGPAARLWERGLDHTDLLQVRIGLGDVPSGITVRSAGACRAPALTEVPVIVDLTQARVIGLCGPRGSREALARNLFGQLATLCSPVEVALRCHPGTPDWAWLRRLPHAAGDRCPPIIVRLLGAGEALPAPLPEGDHVIVLADRTQDLPRGCVAAVELAEVPGEPSWLRRAGSPPQQVLADLPDAEWADQLADALSELRDGTPELLEQQRIPDQVRLLDLIPRDPAEIAAAWLAAAARPGPPARLAAPVGRTRNSVWSPCLVADGPHTLMAGTTGAGKSEALLAWVTALATLHPPEQVSFLLVDYKGGATFGALACLPHVAGVVTDLDAATSRRAISSLFAELRRRERVSVAGAPPSPRLLIVVDEFRVLAEEQPDLLAALVRVAGVGRGLGVHLVLATQRPAGVVNGEIRANTALRVALRVRERADSQDVIDAPDAARLATRTPGRALVRHGADELVEVQLAWLTADDRRRQVAAVQACARLLGSTVPPPPWLPELPERLTLADLADLTDLVATDGAPPPAGLPYAMADLPTRQRREPVAWDGTRGHLAIVGGPGSGRTTTLRTVAAAVARSPRAGGLQVHVLDAGGGWADLTHAPAGRSRIGTVVDAQDTDRAARLLELIGQRSPAEPTVLLIDDWDHLAQSWATVDSGRLLDDLLRLARQGAATGPQVAITGGRALLTGTIASLVTDRLLLPSADPGITVLAGIRSASPRAVPGRGLLIRHGEAVEVQVALPSPPEVPDESRCLPTDEGGAARAGRLEPLPEQLTLTTLLAHPGRVTLGATGVVPLGLGGDDATPVGLPLDAPGALICGPPGSGRSTTLTTLAAMLLGMGRQVIYAAPTPSDQPLPAGVTAVTGRRELTEVIRRELAGGEATLLLDTGWNAVAGLEDLAHHHLLTAAPPTGQPPRVALQVVAAGTAAEVAMALRGVLAELRTARCGVLLGPRVRADGAAVGAAVRGCAALPAGRGILAVRGRVTRIQVARPATGRSVLA